MLCLRFRTDQLQYLREQHALPRVVQATPARDAVKVGGDYGLREREQFSPREFQRSGDLAGNSEVPLGLVEAGNAAVVEDGPFQSEGLAGRETAFGASLGFELLAVAVCREEGHWTIVPECSRLRCCAAAHQPAPLQAKGAAPKSLVGACAILFGMTARTLDGLKIRDQIFSELKAEVAQLTAQGVRPGLAAVLVGENPASQLYVKSKVAACEQLGMASWLHTPPASVPTEWMLQLVSDLNNDDNVDGILIQLPLPAQVDSKRVLEAVSPAKDVDGFHPVSMGMLMSNRPGLVACTPAGCMEILRRNDIAIEGANAIVLGRSDIVGKPMALLLLHANATVTICHSKSRDLPGMIRRADILVAAIGRAGFVQADWIRPGAAVIDVGTNKVTDAAEAERLLGNFPERLEKFRAKGNVLIGDVHPDAVNTAGALSPVPGGVGPMTITMLMSNTVKAARLRRVTGKSQPASVAR
jgi:methylenetetrahydrofolate dehydrogenase (NADP+)/methenyltetrahydrofolate cyclohydrolase